MFRSIYNLLLSVFFTPASPSDTVTTPEGNSPDLALSGSCALTPVSFGQQTEETASPAVEDAHVNPTNHFFGPATSYVAAAVAVAAADERQSADMPLCRPARHAGETPDTCARR